MNVRRCTLILIALIVACTQPDGTGPGTSTEVESYLQGLPGWAQFSPPQPDQAPAPTGTATLTNDTVASVTAIDPQGNPITQTNVPFICEVTPYRMQENPDQFVMYNPDASILWPGSLVQGVSHRDVGSLLPLIIAQRAPVNVSIPSLQTTPNFLRVTTVNQANVAQAIGTLIGNSQATGLQSPQKSSFKMESFHSEQEFALSLGLSARYLGFSGKASGSTSRNSSENTVAVQFFQEMFTVVVEAPPTPGGWFTSDFTPARLNEQVTLGRIGPANLPIFLSEVVYGRMMMFAVTSTASVTDIRAALNAKYSNVVGGGSGSLSEQHKQIMERSTVAIATYGGNDRGTAAMIRTGDWREYFTAEAPLTTALPLSYTFRNLADNSIASVVEATSYNIRTCHPAGAGQFDELPEQTVTRPVPAPFEVIMGDVNGDQRADLVFNHRAPNVNEVAVALGGPQGTFGTPVAVSHPAAAAESWGAFRLVTGDVNDDDRLDLVWTRVDATTNKTYVATGEASGGLTFLAAQSHPLGANWSGYELVLGDLDGDGDDDFVWNGRTNGGNYAYTALASDGVFAQDTIRRTLRAGGDWRGPARTYFADLNRDGLADYVLNYLTTINHTYSALSLGNGQFAALAGAHVYPGAYSGWGGAAEAVIGDFNGDQVPDFNWTASDATLVHAHSGVGTGSGGFQFPMGSDGFQWIAAEGPVRTLGGDVNGDGRWDVIWNRRTNVSNRIQVGRGTPSSRGDLSTTGPSQNHAVSLDWTAATTLVGDVTGEGRADIVWVFPGSPTRIFVGRSRPN